MTDGYRDASVHRFTRDGRLNGEFLGQWTGMGGPNDISRGKDGNYYIAEQENDGKPAQVCVRDANGTVLARCASTVAMTTASASTRAATSTPD